MIDEVIHKINCIVLYSSDLFPPSYYPQSKSNPYFYDSTKEQADRYI